MHIHMHTPLFPRAPKLLLSTEAIYFVVGCRCCTRWSEKSTRMWELHSRISLISFGIESENGHTRTAARLIVVNSNLVRKYIIRIHINTLKWRNATWPSMIWGLCRALSQFDWLVSLNDFRGCQFICKNSENLVPRLKFKRYRYMYMQGCLHVGKWWLATADIVVYTSRRHMKHE